MTKAKLRSCPKCHRKDCLVCGWNYRFLIRCDNCGYSMSSESQQGVEAAWNLRATDKPKGKK
jgi:transcription elongation factor Elf1